MPTLKRILSNAQVRNLLLLVIVIAVFCVFQMGRGSGVHSLQFDNENKSMMLIAPGGKTSVAIKYEDIKSVSEAASLDLGTCIDGIDTKKCRFGTWSNDAYGEYTLCISPKIKDYIVLETVHGIVVLNFESKDSTQHLYPALLDLLETHQNGE